MKATGIVRKIDELGRIVIPKEIRKTLRIREGDPLEIYTDREGQIILKKYSPIGELSEFSQEYCEALYESTGFIAMISDRDTIIAMSKGSKKEYIEKKISPELERIIEGKNTYVNGKDNEIVKIIYEDESPDIYSAQVIAPIVMEGEALGSVILLSYEKGNRMEEVEVKLAETGAGFLSKQMED